MGWVCSMRPSRDLLAVDEERPGAALSEPAAVVGEVETDRRLSGCKRLLRRDRRTLHAEEVVVVGGDAVLHVERPAAEAASLHEDRAVGAALRNLDLGSDRLGLVLHAEEDVLHHPGHPLGERQGGAPRHQVGTADGRRERPLEEAVVEGEDVVLPGLREELRLQLLELRRLRSGQVPAQAEVVLHVVELPGVAVEGGAGLLLPRGPCGSSGRTSPRGRRRGSRRPRSTASCAAPGPSRRRSCTSG